MSLLPPGFRHQCNEVSRYGKKEAGTGEHLTHFNNKINKHKWKAAAPHGRLPHTKHKLKSRPGPLSSSTVVTPHLTLPKLLRGTRDRWVVQVSFITNYSTGLAPFPRLSALPHSSQRAPGKQWVCTLPSANLARMCQTMRLREEISNTGGGGVIVRSLDRFFCCCTQGPWFPGAGMKDIWEDRLPRARGLCRETHGVEVVGVLAACCILRSRSFTRKTMYSTGHLI